MSAGVGSRRGVAVSRAHRGARRSGVLLVAVAGGSDRAGVGQRERMVEIQRSRLLAAAVGAVDELGYADVTVSDVASRARVSRRTFYELFSNREQCLTAVLEDVVGLVGGEIAAADVGSLGWRERVRGGLWVILSFLDREPALARVCVVQVLRGGPGLLGRREEILAGLARIVDEGRLVGARGGGCTSLTAEGVVGAAFAIVYARLLRGEREPLTGLLGELMGMIVLPYLGPAAARRELQRPVEPLAPTPTGTSDDSAAGVLEDPFKSAGMRLTYRTVRVLLAVSEHPGDSNRTIGESAGMTDPGQISKLLGRLQRLGLIENTGLGPGQGAPNAWALTSTGRQFTKSIDAHRGASHGGGLAGARTEASH